MSQCRRDNLTALTSNNQTHAGLWFDKYLAKQKSETLTPYQDLVQQCSQIRDSAAYKIFYKRWRQALESMKIEPRFAEVNGRITIGLGNASVIETGITLHHTYGVPYIPGSGLKGSAARYAHAHLEGTWRKDGTAHETLFGSQSFAGLITFFDALPKPGKWKLHQDVITVHHPEYYQQGNVAPADWDNPTPIPFLSVSGTFMVGLYAPPDAAAWVESAYGILRMALDEIGAGAKTSSGYGRFSLRKKLPLGYKRGIVDTDAQGPNQSYWYIKVEGSTQRVFTHRNDLTAGLDYLEKGWPVVFKKISKQGQSKAIDVSLE